MDHRRLQRALFRIQHDPAFAARLRAGEEQAIASAALGDRELAMLRAADPVAVAADREGRRAAQLLRNVSSEFRLSLSLGPAGDAGAAWIEGFPSSPFFHEAVAADAPLPLAFAAFAEQVAAGAPSASFGAVVALEAAMARVRRTAAPTPAVASGEVVRVGASALADLPRGTHAVAAMLTRAAASQEMTPSADLVVTVRERETLLLAADSTAEARFGGLRPLRVEPLSPLVAGFLREAARPLALAARSAYAAAHGVGAHEVEAVVAEYVAEGILVRGA